MPQQGPRAALGDQGGGGAVLTPVRRLTLAGVGVIGGGMLVAAGTRMTWAKAVYGGQPVTAPGIPRVIIGGGELRLDASDVGAGYLFGLGLLLALIPLGWLATGPRARVALGILGVVIAAAIGVGVATARGDMTSVAGKRGTVLLAGNESAFFRTRSGSGSGVTAAGAALGFVSCIGGASAGARIPRMRMPEKPGEDERP